MASYMYHPPLLVVLEEDPEGGVTYRFSSCVPSLQIATLFLLRYSEPHSPVCRG